MKTRTTLSLMEQMVMVLVFALAATLCVRVFALADRMSRNNEARDQAVLELQSAAEHLKAGKAEAYLEMIGAEMNGTGGFCIGYDADWNLAEENITYRLIAEPVEVDDLLLWTMELRMETAEGEELFHLPVSGQRGGGA